MRLWSEVEPTRLIGNVDRGRSEMCGIVRPVRCTQLSVGGAPLSIRLIRLPMLAWLTWLDRMLMTSFKVDYLAMLWMTDAWIVIHIGRLKASRLQTKLCVRMIRRS